MLCDSSVALKIETVRSVSVGVFCVGTVGSCFVRAPWAAVLVMNFNFNVGFL
jgi:hypothetical protein